MKAVSKSAQRILDLLFADLAVGGERKLDNGGTGIMPVHVLRRDERVYSVAHIYFQNGDAMYDPEIDFYKGADDCFYPVTYTQSGLGIHRDLIQLDADGAVTGCRRLAQADAAAFCTGWMRNVAYQQRIQDSSFVCVENDKRVLRSATGVVEVPAVSEVA